MKNLLRQTNEEAIKQISADFFTMSVYSKDILCLDKFRVNNYFRFKIWYKNQKYKKVENLSNTKKYNELWVFLKENKYKFIATLGISFILVYKFRSILIIPFFLSNYFLLKNLLFNKIIDNCIKEDMKCVCYFCNENIKKQTVLQKYDYYYKLINYVCERNPNIKNIKEFEEEMNKLSKEILK